MLSKTRNSRSLHRVIAYTGIMVSVIYTLMLDVSHAVEVFSAMFAGGVRFHTAVVFLIQ